MVPPPRPATRSSAPASAALAPVPLPDIAACDSPVGRGRPAFFVRRPVLDPGHLAGCAGLAPAHAIVPVEDECGVGLALPDSLLFRGTVVRRVPRIFEVERHAPAPAKDAYIVLHLRGERGPRRLIDSLHGVRRFGHEAQPNAAPRHEPYRLLTAVRHHGGGSR